MSKFTFGQKMLVLRRSKKISQKDLAQKLGIAYSSIARYETDQVLPSADILVKLSNFFGVSIDYLLKDESDVLLVDDRDVLRLASEIDKLPNADKEKLKNMIKSFLKPA